MILCVTPNPAIDRTLIVPGLRVDGVNRAESSRTAAGGKGVNVARAARSLGEDVLCAGFVGGIQGAHFEELARREGIAGKWTPIAGETRSALILIDPVSGDNTVVNEPGPLTSEADWIRFQRDVEAQARAASMVCLCGSVPPGTPAAAYPALVSALVNAGLPVWIDASGAPLASVEPLTGVHLKINLSEAESLLQRPLQSREDAIAAAVSLGRDGQRRVIITLGDEGAILAASTGLWWARPPAIERLNAVGSGDSFLAGLVSALQRGACEDLALAWGTAAGAANAQSAGGASFDRRQFDAALAGVTVMRL